MNLNEQTNRIKQMMGISESVSSINSVLSIGSKGSEVEELQKTLKMYVDSKFGQQTKDCVIDFQRKMRINDDGIVGGTTKKYLAKLEKGEVKWVTPEFCKTKEYTPQTLLQTKSQTTSNSTSEKSSTTGSKGDLILMGGLDNRPGDLSIGQQVQSIKTNLSNKNVIGFRYNDISGVLQAVKNNPNAYVVLFSAGCKYASQIAPLMNDKKKMFIVEPYAKSTSTAQSVQTAVSLGVPNKNVVAGPVKERGAGVVSSTTNTPQGQGHWSALQNVGQLIA